MAGALFHITDAGRAALVAAGNTGTNAHKVVEIGLSTGLFDATDRTLKKLPNELKRITTFAGDNVAPDTIHVTLRDDTTDQYKLYGLGLYFENGVLFGVYCQNAADGPIMEKSPAALLLLSADALFATIDAGQLVFGDASFTNPPATTERQGIVELATQDEVNAGRDDSRAITPKTAANRYAALTGAGFSGPVSVAAAAGDTEAQMYVMGASGANSREGKMRFYGTFGNNADTNARLAASIRAGFNGGNWGTEYLDFCLNYGAANDAQKDSLQARVLRLVAGGRALFNTTTDDGTNIAQFGGNVSTRGVHTFGYGSTVAWATTDAAVAYFRSNGNVSLGSEAAAGFLDLVAGGGASRMRLLPSGRILIGKSEDDGINIAQFGGNTRAYGTVFSGLAGSVTAWMASDTGYGYFRTAGNASVGSEAAFGYTELMAGNRSWLKVMPSGRVLIGDTANDDGTNRIQVDGPARFNGNLYLNRSASEGQIWLGPNDGYFFANGQQAGYYSPKYGQYQYDFALKNLTVQNYGVWHAGNLKPLDVTTGGTLYNDVTFTDGKRLLLAEGSAAFPSLTFVNDGAPDTGLYHVNDGTFAVTCNGVTTIRFTPSITAFDRPVTGPTPAAGDVSTLLATTEWVTSKIAAAAIGQIVMEPRTAARAGYLKANGTLLKRADYPALFAYAAASGAIVTEAQWSGGNWGCFSWGTDDTTFRIPELRGEHLRCWDDGRGLDASRGIGSWQDSQNRAHAHGASAAAVGDHGHTTWTEAGGYHDHPVADPGHAHGYVSGTVAGANQGPGAAVSDRNADNRWRGTEGAYTNIGVVAAGSHGHNIGMNGAGAHSHTISVNSDGGTETRVRNVALLAMIRAY